MRELLIPKEALLPKLKKEIVPGLTKEMKAMGISKFNFVDMEWNENGITIFYKDSATNKPKQDENSS